MTFISRQVPDVCLIFSPFPSFSVPAPPRNLRVDSVDQNQITFKWDPPVNASTVEYSVKLSSRFWGHSFYAKVDKETHKFDQLKSGTKYEVEVQTVVDNMSSPAEKLFKSTGEAFWPVFIYV